MIVRSTGGGNAVRPLVLPTLWTNAAQANLDSAHQRDRQPKRHEYDYDRPFLRIWPFSVNIAGNTKFDAATINDITTSIDAVYNTFVSNGIPVVIGEYGLLGFDNSSGTIEHGEMLKYFEYFLQYSKSKNVTHMLWDNGQHFNRTTYQWNDPDLYKIIKQSLTGRSSTADTDLIFLKSGAAVGDAVIHLNLNGNSFYLVKNGTTTLKSGRDYSLSGSILTVKASYLSKYASGGFGEKAVLTVNSTRAPAGRSMCAIIIRRLQNSFGHD